MSQEIKKDITNAYVNRKHFLKENKISVLLALDKSISIWLDKKFVKKNDFCLSASVGIKQSWKYKVYNQDIELTGSEVLNKLKELN